MAVSLTDHQWTNVKLAAEWHKEACRTNFELDTSAFEPFFNENAKRPTMLGKGQDFFFGGYAGTGKAVPMDTVVITDDGSKRMHEIAVGDHVIGQNGKPTKVLGAYPQGVKPSYRVTFRDRTSVVCCDEHLWTVQTVKMRSNNKWKTISLREIVDTGVKFDCGIYRYFIPLCAPVEYNTHATLPIDPYVLGTLLGDGSLGDGKRAILTIGNADIEMAELIEERLPANFTLSRQSPGQGCQRFYIKRKKEITAEGKAPSFAKLVVSTRLDVSGPDKFIPKEYLTASVADRIELLRGLMDTDGSARGNRISFCTKAVGLATGVAALVQSLGGTSIIRTCERKRTGEIEYDVNVKVQFNPFRILRKAEQWTFSKKNPPSRAIISVEYVGEVEQQCIKVAAADGLFLIEDFIVTHNTTVMPAVLEEFGLTPAEVAFCAPTGKAAKVMGGKLNDFGIRATPTTIHKLIYLPKAERAQRIQTRMQMLSEQIVRAKTQGGIILFADNNGPSELTLAQAERKMIELGFDLARAMENNEGPTFTLRRREDIPEGIKLIIVDEGSMVGEFLATDLASFGLPILAFGDPGQLPPVGDTYGFDCENPDAFLTEIHRQAADNPIIRLATMAREGKALKLGNYGDGVEVVERIKDKATLDMSREAMVLCGTHVKRWTLTKKIRTALGYTETGPCGGEPLIFRKNSRKLTQMVNGTLVTCASEVGDLHKGDSSFKVKIKDTESDGAEYDIEVVQGLFEEHTLRKKNAYTSSSNAAFSAKKTHEHLDFGHVLTVHNSQGSQWDEVVVHDESGAFRDAASRWLYTGITRAAKRLTVVV